MRGQEPALDRLPAEARERDVPDVDGHQAGVVRFEGGGDGVGAGVGQRVRPEGVEVGRLLALGLVDAQLGERQIVEHG